MKVIQPEGWKEPIGYSNGIAVSGIWKNVHVSGQIAWDKDCQLVGAGDIAVQFEQALRNVVSVVQAAGGEAEHVARLTIFITDKAAYLAARKDIGSRYRKIFGTHYPAMALVIVAGLLEDGAMVEIEAAAGVPI